jgi:hypothetical protein
MAYIRPVRGYESPQAFRRRIYLTLRTPALAKSEARTMRTTLLHPSTDWNTVWTNLQNTWVPEYKKSTWYKVIHDIMATKERLRAINLCDTEQCKACGNRDTIMHRITDCGSGSAIWEETRKRIARILNTDPVNIPKDWTIRPQFDIRPPHRRKAILWFLGHMIWYMLRVGHAPSEQDYSDFLRRARWKTCQTPEHRRLIGTYLDTL